MKAGFDATVLRQIKSELRTIKAEYKGRVPEESIDLVADEFIQRLADSRVPQFVPCSWADSPGSGCASWWPPGARRTARAKRTLTGRSYFPPAARFRVCEAARSTRGPVSFRRGADSGRSRRRHPAERLRELPVNRPPACRAGSGRRVLRRRRS